MRLALTVDNCDNRFRPGFGLKHGLGHRCGEIGGDHSPHDHYLQSRGTVNDIHFDVREGAEPLHPPQGSSSEV
jgi:hypothetical protein